MNLEKLTSAAIDDATAIARKRAEADVDDADADAAVMAAAIATTTAERAMRHHKSGDGHVDVAEAANLAVAAAARAFTLMGGSAQTWTILERAMRVRQECRNLGIRALPPMPSWPRR